MVPGSLDDGRLTTALGIVAAIVGLVGFLVFGWRFGGSGSSSPVSTVLAVVAVAVAVGATLWRS